MALVKDALNIAANLLLPKINLKRQSTYLSSEILSYSAKYTDPLSLSFKCLFEYGKPYGLFADEIYPDSALAYLKRIGEEGRYQLLKNWIHTWKDFMRYYDWLFLTVDGLEGVQNANPHDNFKEEEAKITFTVREPLDMSFQALLTIYRQIWFDDIRQVEILPANLRRFDMYVLVYPVGIYNSAFYDECGNPEPYESMITKTKDLAKNTINGAVDTIFGNNSEGKEDPNIELKMFPTARKLSLSEHHVVMKHSEEYNHQTYIFGDCQINNTESGKTFATSITNEAGGGDIVKNTLCMSYRFGRYKGRYNNVFGDLDCAKLLCFWSKLQREQKILVDRENLSIKSKLTDGFSSYLDKLKDSASDTLKDMGNTLVDKADSTLGRMIGGGTAPIGNVYKDYDIFNPDYLTKMVKNTFEQGIDKASGGFVGGFNKLDNLTYNNFSNEMFGLYTDVFRRKSQANSPKEFKNNTPTTVVNNKPSLFAKSNDNIYKRKNF